MDKKLSLKEIVKELSVLVPLWGLISVESRVRNGDTPLIFKNMNEDNKTGFEILCENEGNNLNDYQRQKFRYEEHLIKTGVFLTYQGVTTASLFFKGIESFY